VAPFVRVVRRLVRNWPLKLGAVALATVLYAGLVLSQNARIISVRVPIEPVRQPVGAFLLDDLKEVTSIRFYAPADVATRVTSTDFQATADLGSVRPTSGGLPVAVPVTVTPLDPRIRVIDFVPRLVSVRLDPVVTRTVPIVVEQGTVPVGLDVGKPQLDITEVKVRGGSTLVERVEHVVAAVTIDPNAINVDDEVDLVAVDERGQIVQPVDIDPEQVRVRIAVGSEAVTRSLPVAPMLSGSVAEGYRVAAVTVEPASVTVSGPATVVAGLVAVDTEPLDIGGRSSLLTATSRLRIPTDVTILGATEVAVRVEVEAQEGSRTLEVGLSLSGARADRSYSLAAPSVLVILGGDLPVLARIDAASLSASLAVGTLGFGQHDVPVTFRAPAGTQLVGVSPLRVQVTISPPPTPPPSPAPTATPVP
jgi:YbbR domain-containing protein